MPRLRPGSLVRAAKESRPFPGVKGVVELVPPVAVRRSFSDVLYAKLVGTEGIFKDFLRLKDSKEWLPVRKFWLDQPNTEKQDEQDSGR